MCLREKTPVCSLTVVVSNFCSPSQKMQARDTGGPQAIGGWLGALVSICTKLDCLVQIINFDQTCVSVLSVQSLSPCIL